MRKGDCIGEYRLTTDGTTSGGGQCMWAFAEKDGKAFFLKQFLEPTFPLPDGPGSERIKAAKLERCVRFEKRHRDTLRTVKTMVAPGGNLIFTIAFFRSGAKYYKVTERVDGVALDSIDFCALDIKERLLLAKTLTHSLGILHRLGLVHGDFKPSNVIVAPTALKTSVCKLIDFDNSFVEGKPPESADMVSDLAFLSPEMIGYVQKKWDGSASDLTRACDLFALGLVLVHCLTGAPVAVDRDLFQYPANAVLMGGEIGISEDISPGLRVLIRNLLSIDPAQRPRTPEVLEALKTAERGIPEAVVDERTKSRTDTSAPDVKSKLRGSLISGGGTREGMASDSAERPKLRGSLVDGTKRE